MKVSKYVTKYDFLNYYTKQKGFWFFTNAEISAILKTKIEMLSKQKNNDDVIDEEDDEKYDDSKLDSLNFFKELKLDSEFVTPNNNNNDNLLSTYLTNLENLKNVDNDNPLMIEGRILDGESKKHILKKYNNENNCFVVDFDEQKINLDDCCSKAKELIEQYDYLIIFQPVFIDKKRMIATKCDALVKYNDEIFIIETKGTTTAKVIHYLDLLFQKKLIDNISYLSNYSFSYRLCLVKYEKLNKKQVSFIDFDTINLAKTGPSKKNNQTIEERQEQKIGIKITTDKKGNTKDTTLYINDLLYRCEVSENLSSRTDNKIEDMFSIDDNFDKTIKELWDQKNSMNSNSWPYNIEPNFRDFWSYKNSDFKPELRKLFSLEGYKIFNYSGNVIDQTHQKINHLMNDVHDPKNLSKAEFSSFLKNRNNFDTNLLTIDYDCLFVPLNKNKIIQQIGSLKNKKVYFDFETINSSIRAFDNTLPFMQTVTQCSIIKTKNDDYKNAECNNMMQDPLDINVEWFKAIVDNLHEGKDVSYIVYNESFEKTRLNEMKEYINDPIYDKKIDDITNHLFDLAFFFDLDKSLIYVPELYGFYSIKKVLPLIEKYYPNIFKETKCLDYKKLEIGNGLVCQQNTTKRFFEMINDEQWKEIVKQSKIYCENDVRAMIAVELFIKELVKDMIK